MVKVRIFSKCHIGISYISLWECVYVDTSWVANYVSRGAMYVVESLS